MYTNLARYLLRSLNLYRDGSIKIGLYPKILPIEEKVPYGIEMDRENNQILFNIDMNEIEVYDHLTVHRLREEIEKANEETGIALVYSGYTGERKVVPVSAVIRKGDIYLVKYGNNFIPKRRTNKTIG